VLTTKDMERDDIYELTSDQRDWRETLREFADKEIAPHAARYDDASEFPWDSVKKMRDLGLFGLVFPEKYGGQGAGTGHRRRDASVGRRDRPRVRAAARHSPRGAGR